MKLEIVTLLSISMSIN